MLDLSRTAGKMPKPKPEFTVRYAEINPQEIHRRLVRNPAYNHNRVALNSWCWLPLRDQRKPMLQEAIEESIKDEGIRNPIVVYCLQEGYFLCFGGTRLRAARNLGLTAVPCIVNDYVGTHSGDPEVTPDNVLSFYEDEPPWYEFGKYGFDQHYNLERARRENATGAGFEWLRGRDSSFVRKEMPWAEDLLPED